MMSFSFCLVLCLLVDATLGFSPVPRVLSSPRQLSARNNIYRSTATSRLWATVENKNPQDDKTTSNNKLSDGLKPNLKAAAQPDNVLNLDADATREQPEPNMAATGTVNDRLLAELQQAADKEKYGAKTDFGKKLGLARPRKSEEEQAAALAEARDLNGVNPVVCLTGGVFALAVAAGLWYATQKLGVFFALHPVDADVYFVQRLASVFRNVVMGMASLASGFFCVTGVGIFMLGVRVAIGVAKGELDPTPIKKKQIDAPEIPNVWDLMMNKKPGRRGGGKKDTNNPFGL